MAYFSLVLIVVCYMNIVDKNWAAQLPPQPSLKYAVDKNSAALPPQPSLKYAVDNYTLWDMFRLTYEILESIPDEAKPALKRAFNEWEDNTPFLFVDTQGGYVGDMSVGYFRGEHGDSLPFDGRGNVLAHTVAQYKQAIPEWTFIHFDADENWCFDNAYGVPYDAQDFQTVALHEIGHMLGLAHSEDPSAVMFESIGAGQVKHLTNDDIAGVLFLYPD